MSLNPMAVYESCVWGHHLMQLSSVFCCENKSPCLQSFCLENKSFFPAYHMRAILRNLFQLSWESSPGTSSSGWLVSSCLQWFFCANRLVFTAQPLAGSRRPWENTGHVCWRSFMKGQWQEAPKLMCDQGTELLVALLHLSMWESLQEKEVQG